MSPEAAQRVVLEDAPGRAMITLLTEPYGNQDFGFMSTNTTVSPSQREMGSMGKLHVIPFSTLEVNGDVIPKHFSKSKKNSTKL